MRDLLTIQADIDSTERAIQAGGVDQSQLDMWNAQKAEFEKEKIAALQLLQDHVDRVEQSATLITDTLDATLDSFKVGEFSFSDLCTTPDSYGLMKIGFKQLLISQSTISSQQISDIQANFQSQLRAAVDKDSQLTNQLEALQKQNSQNKAERDDFEQRFTNATALLDEANKKIEQQDSHINDLLKDAAVGARNGFKVIDTEEQQRQIDEISKKINDSKIRITNLQPVDGGFGAKPIWYTATDVLTKEELRISWVALNSYINLDSTGAEQFRQSQALPSVTINNSQVASPPGTINSQDVGTDFRNQAVSSGLESSTGGQDQGVQAEVPVTRVEFEKLKIEVRAISTNLGMSVGAA